MTYGRDPTSAPRRPRNPHGMWICDDCGTYNDPELDECSYCEHHDDRPLPSLSPDT